MAMVMVIWGAEAVAIITVGAEVTGITMDGRAADITDGIEAGALKAATGLFLTPGGPIWRPRGSRRRENDGVLRRSPFVHFVHLLRNEIPVSA
jgi:hypothetical protein